MPIEFKPESAARIWPPLARFIVAEDKIGRAAERRGSFVAVSYEFLRFGIKQGWACLFGGLMVALLIATYLVYPQGTPLARYDFIFLAAFAIQVALLVARLETIGEAGVILLFHVVGTAMEVFKTSTGSWVYPEPSTFRLLGVPLFTGFMYASVGSYIARAWRLFDFRFERYPPRWAVPLLAVAIYANFFADHYGFDARWVLLAITMILFGRTVIYFHVWRVHRRMPLIVGFGLVALFIWFAENVGTYAGAWLYPSQRHVWSVVPATKLGSWFLLMIISYALVALTHRIRSPHPVER